jgi:hypothetical protein
VDFRTANFDDIAQFVKNILPLEGGAGADSRARTAYYVASTQLMMSRNVVESVQKLATEIDNARGGIARGLDKLERSVNEASKASDVAAKRLERATWGLVAGTVLLAVATARKGWTEPPVIEPVLKGGV